MVAGETHHFRKPTHSYFRFKLLCDYYLMCYILCLWICHLQAVLQVANTPIAMPGFADLSVIVTIVLLGMVWFVSFGKVFSRRGNLRLVVFHFGLQMTFRFVGMQEIDFKYKSFQLQQMVLWIVCQKKKTMSQLQLSAFLTNLPVHCLCLGTGSGRGFDLRCRMHRNLTDRTFLLENEAIKLPSMEETVQLDRTTERAPVVLLTRFTGTIILKNTSPLHVEFVLPDFFSTVFH